ncbi:protein tyrosine phosphatase family protein [Acinetobacter towneri]|uniref:protein tyrosine phosphatase family protein n=1 Tax=Acinetobacter towneri TaxID=202956 RepID=UPI0020974F75|nr:protein tyrosine phosphatase family protein [Acinetobacter towneri]MCO8048126.1 protein tyrosine phosphatase family protein [Acinetobacter towneri]
MNDIETQLSQIKNFQFIHERLFSSGQPTAEELKQIKEYGISTVINLAESDAEHALPHEDKICLDVGLNYIQLPISWETPSSDQCLLLLDLVNHLLESQMVWVHCSNNNHVSSLMYLYRQYFMDVDIATAQDFLHDIWKPNETWTGLIHAVSLQLQGRKATQDLQQALESAET